MRSRLASRLSSLFAALVLFACAAPVRAAECPTGSVCLQNPLQVDNLPELIGVVLRGLISIVGALALLVFIFAGFKWLILGGEAAKIKEAKEMMKWAVIGLVVVFTSYGLVRFVFSAITG